MSEPVPSTSPEDLAHALADLVYKHAKTLSKQDRMPGAHLLSQDEGQQTIQVENRLSVGEYVAQAIALTDPIRRIPANRIHGGETEHPAWGMLETPEGHTAYPISVLAHLHAGEITPFECIMRLAHASHSRYGEGNIIELTVRAEHAEPARRWLAELAERADRGHNPLRGRFVELYFAGGDIYPRVIAPPEGRLEDVIVPQEVLHELDRNVMTHLAARDMLVQAGLGSNRGVLLYGPPGTGKTSLVRAVANLVAKDATVFLPSPEITAEALSVVYQDAVRLAPSVVVLEDIDVVATNRRGQRTGSLASFLQVLDGVVSDPGALVITIATTNDPDGIDDAAKRPGRIDKFIEVPLPDRKLRESILHSYRDRLVAAGIAVEVTDETLAGIAAASNGASGALLREVVRRGLLLAHREGPGTALREPHLLEASAEIGYRIVATGSGIYL